MEDEEKSNTQIECECWQNIVDRLDDEKASGKSFNHKRYTSSVRQLHYLRSLMKDGFEESL